MAINVRFFVDKNRSVIKISHERIIALSLKLIIRSYWNTDARKAFGERVMSKGAIKSAFLESFVGISLLFFFLIFLKQYFFNIPQFNAF